MVACQQAQLCHHTLVGFVCCCWHHCHDPHRLRYVDRVNRLHVDLESGAHYGYFLV